MSELDFSDGWIKIHRKILKSSIYQNSITLHMALHCILRANWEEKKILFDGKEIILEKGQFISGLHEIVKETHISMQSARTALKNLKNINFLTIKSTNRFSTFTIVNYSDYQDLQSTPNKQTNNPLTSYQQSTNKPLTTDKNIRIKELKELKKKSKPIGQPKSLADSGFDLFWLAYPKHVAKKNAIKAWNKIKPDETLTKKILDAIQNHRETEQWKKGKGDFIPHPASWLNSQRWEDDLTTENFRLGDNVRLIPKVEE